MATAIMILSNEGGKEGVITIAASKSAAKEVVRIAKRAKGSKYVGIETMATMPLLSEALKVINDEWEKEFCRQGGEHGEKSERKGS